MTDHISTSQMKRFCAKALPKGELTNIARHLADCPSCHEQFTEELRRQKGSDHFGFTLAPEFWFRHDHLDFEQLADLADEKLDETEREIVDVHLNVCATCCEDVRSFLAFRKQIDSELERSYAPTGYAPKREGFSWVTWWRGLRWKPAYAIATVVLVAVALAIVALVLKRRAENLQAQKNEPAPISARPSPTPMSNKNAASLPSPSPEPSKLRQTMPRPAVVDTSATVVALKDGRGEVTLDRSGNLTGLSDVSPTTRREIADALLAERVETPEVLNDLVGQGGTLRGPNSGPSFRLISPGRTVILEDRPVFKWEKLPNASSYRVYVGDSSGHEVAKSEELPSERTEWPAPKPLKRGEIYAWAVIAIVDGKEIFSPGAASPQMKFQVLSTSNLEQLNQLEKTRSHLALGVFYAKAGLLAEAEREFQELVRLNPKSQLPRKLLRSLRSLRESKSR